MFLSLFLSILPSLSISLSPSFPTSAIWNICYIWLILRINPNSSFALNTSCQMCYHFTLFSQYDKRDLHQSWILFYDGVIHSQENSFDPLANTLLRFDEHWINSCPRWKHCNNIRALPLVICVMQLFVRYRFYPVFFHFYHLQYGAAILVCC